MFSSDRVKIVKKCLLPMFLVTCMCFFLVTTNPAVANADTIGPVYTQVSPANGATLSQSFVYISLNAVDMDLVNNSSVVMTIDGKTVSPSCYFKPINESTDDPTTLVIEYSASFSNGTHTINVSTKDQLGNASSTSWSFTVNQPLQISANTPAGGSVVTTFTPVISALVNPAANVDPNSIVMTLNNTPVNAALDPIAGKISYIPVSPLNNETFYNVALNFKGLDGTAVSSSWKFYVSTYPDMPYSVDDTTCQKCHDRTKHPMSSCAKCHGQNPDASKLNYPLDDCYRCHFGSTNYPATYHTNGLPVANPPSHPVQITDSCVFCHNQTFPSTNIPKVHQTFDLGIQHTAATTGCSQCHSTSLTREHQRRQDALGITLTCFTCHNSPDPNVQNAIATKNTNCAACHTGVANGHPAHNNGLDQYCQTCHSSTILEEPQFHSKNGCAVCHDNTTNPLVKYNINLGDTSCFACHTQGHNVNFVEKNPDDVPLYPGFQWTVPQPATIWAGETWLSSDFNSAGAKIMISNRRTDVSGTDLFNWYTQSLTGNGWQKVSGPDSGSDYFTLSYQKGQRLLNVNVYTGASHDQASAYVGYRVEVLYK